MVMESLVRSLLVTSTFLINVHVSRAHKPILFTNQLFLGFCSGTDMWCCSQFFALLCEFCAIFKCASHCLLKMPWKTYALLPSSHFYEECENYPDQFNDVNMSRFVMQLKYLDFPRKFLSALIYNQNGLHPLITRLSCYEFNKTRKVPSPMQMMCLLN